VLGELDRRSPWGVSDCLPHEKRSQGFLGHGTRGEVRGLSSVPQSEQRSDGWTEKMEKKNAIKVVR